MTRIACLGLPRARQWHQRYELCDASSGDPSLRNTSSQSHSTPSRGELDDPTLRPLIDHYLKGAGDVSAETRARIFRLGWDFAGTGLAGRNEQYERFYLASAPRNYQLAQIFADRTRADALVGRFLNEPLD